MGGGVSLCVFLMHINGCYVSIGAYQTVPVSRAADTDRALSILVVKTADTRPYCELFALSMAFCWLLKLNIHSTGPKI